jgi:acyl carrier protein
MKPIALDDILARLRAYLLSHAPSDGLVLTGSTSLLDEWFTDSIEVLETVVYLEESFGVDIDRADVNAQNFHTLDTLARFVAERLACRAC